MTLNKVLFGVVAIFIVMGVAAVVIPPVILKTDSKMVTTPVPDVVAVSEPLSEQPLPVYALVEVEQHTDATSCWTIVNGQVHDVTSYIAEHPGGAAAVLKLCGRDGTEAFERKHGSSESARAALTNYVIGIIE